MIVFVLAAVEVEAVALGSAIALVPGGTLGKGSRFMAAGDVLGIVAFVDLSLVVSKSASSEKGLADTTSVVAAGAARVVRGVNLD